jgi:hypothetical protein
MSVRRLSVLVSPGTVPLAISVDEGAAMKSLGRWKMTDDRTIRPTPCAGALVRGIDEPRHRTHDQVPRPSVPPQRGEGQEPEGELLCRLGRHGTTNQWVGEDAGGNRLLIRTGADGRIEVLRPDNGNAGPRAGFASLSPSRDAAERNPAGLGLLQQLLEQHYRPQD